MASTVLEYSKSGEIGISKQIRTAGDGRTPKMGEVLQVDFSIYVRNGTVLREGKNKEVRLGQREVWGSGADLGLVSMRVGERALFTCEHEFAGPDNGHPPTTLDLRLIAITGDGVGLTPSEIRFGLAAAILFACGVICFLWKEGFFHSPLQWTEGFDWKDGSGLLVVLVAFDPSLLNDRHVGKLVADVLDCVKDRLDDIVVGSHAMSRGDEFGRGADSSYQSFVVCPDD